MIFIDRSIPRSVANALKQVRDDVEWLEDRFAHDTPDPVWLTAAGQNGWLVLARDKKIRTRPAERQAIVDHRVGCFIVGQKRDPTRWGYLKLLVGAMGEMESVFAQQSRPFIYMLGASGRLTRFS